MADRQRRLGTDRRAGYRAGMPATGQPCVLVTGMSGTGKSTVLVELGRRGFATHDMDEPGRSFMDANGHQRWDLVTLTAVAKRNLGRPFFVSGCSEDQTAVRHLFTHMVLLSLPSDLLVERIARRTTNDFGKRPAEMAEILESLEHVEPLLRRNATLEIVTTEDVAAVTDRILRACGVMADSTD